MPLPLIILRSAIETGLKPIWEIAWGEGSGDTEHPAPEYLGCMSSGRDELTPLQLWNWTSSKMGYFSHLLGELNMHAYPQKWFIIAVSEKWETKWP